MTSSVNVVTPLEQQPGGLTDVAGLELDGIGRSAVELRRDRIDALDDRIERGRRLASSIIIDEPPLKRQSVGAASHRRRALSSRPLQTLTS